MHCGINGVRSSIHSQVHRVFSRAEVRRGVVVLIALGLIFCRTPSTFTKPQFWGEDIVLFFLAARDGIASIVRLVAGYLTSAQLIVAVVASHFDPILAPAIYNYTAVFLTLLVCWLVTSPRLDMPWKPLLAIAVVIVPMAHEELGTLCNIQWILPIGAFAMLFMRASKSAIVLIGETIFVALMALSGPFSIFLAPMFMWQIYWSKGSIEKIHFLVLTAAIGLGAVAQAAMIVLHPYNPVNAERATVSPLDLWINIPLAQIMTTFGVGRASFFHGSFAALIGALGLVAALVLACQKPYRTQKLFMLLFAAFIALGGLYKFRDDVASQATAERYFYVGSVFALWFICCLSQHQRLRKVLAIAVLLIEVSLLPRVARTPRIIADLEWPVWAKYIGGGPALIVPSSPPGWYLALPPTDGGRLAKFMPWIGTKLNAHVRLDETACKGTMNPIKQIQLIALVGAPPSETWAVAGSAWNTSNSRAVDLVVITDPSGTVMTFGFPGFNQQYIPAPPRSGWTANFQSPGRFVARAFGLIGDNLACPLSGDSYFPTDNHTLASPKSVTAIQILPGKDVVQRLKPTARLQGISLALVTWAKTPTPHSVEWRAVASLHGENVVLGEGTIVASMIRNQQQIDLPMSVIPEEIPEQIELSFQAAAGGDVTNPLGVVTFEPTDGDKSPVEVAGVPAAQPSQIGLIFLYRP